MLTANPLDGRPFFRWTPLQSVHLKDLLYKTWFDDEWHKNVGDEEDKVC